MSHGIMCGAYNIKYQYPITLIRQGDRLQQLGPEQHRLSPLLGRILHIGPRLLSGHRQKPEGGSMPDSSRRAEDHMPWRTSLTMLHPPLLCLWTHTRQQSPHIYNSKRTRSDTRSCVGRGHHLPSWLPCRPLLLQQRASGNPENLPCPSLCLPPACLHTLRLCLQLQGLLWRARRKERRNLCCFFTKTHCHQCWCQPCRNPHSFRHPVTAFCELCAVNFPPSHDQPWGSHHPGLHLLQPVHLLQELIFV